MNAAQRRQSDSLHASATGVARGWASPPTQAPSPPGDCGAGVGGSAAGRAPIPSAGVSATPTSPTSPTSPTPSGGEAADPRPLTEREWERLRRRAALLRDLAEAKDLPLALRATQLRRRRKALRRAL